MPLPVPLPVLPSPGDRLFAGLRDMLLAGNPRGRVGPVRLYAKLKTALQFMATRGLQTVDELAALNEGYAHAQPSQPHAAWNVCALDEFHELAEWLAWRIAYWRFVDDCAWRRRPSPQQKKKNATTPAPTTTTPALKTTTTTPQQGDGTDVVAAQ